MSQKFVDFLFSKDLLLIFVKVFRQCTYILFDLRLNAILKNTSTIGSVTWDGLNARILKLNDIPLSSTIKVGDTVVTGGMSFYFPKGVPIGKIVNYDNSSLEGYYEIDVEIFNDFSSLSNLYILNRTDNYEIQSLLNE